MRIKIARPRVGRLKLSKSFFKFLTFGIVMYVVFLITTLPAGVIYKTVIETPAKQNSIRLNNVSGTVWSGVAGDASVNGIRLGKLEWKMHFIPMLIGRLNFDIKFKSLTTQGHGSVAVSFGETIYAHNLEIRAPLGLFAPLMYGFPVSLDGQLTARIEDLEMNKGSRLNAKGRIVVTNAASTAPQRIEVGDLLLKFDPEQEGSRVTLSDQGGPLLLNGNINFMATGQYSVNMTLAPRENASAALEQSLKFLGRPDAAGKYYFNKKGKLQGW